MTDLGFTTLTAFWTFVSWFLWLVVGAYGLFFLYVWFRDRNGSK